MRVTEVQISDLEVCKTYDGFTLSAGGKPIRTPGGYPIRSENAALLQHMAKEFSTLGHETVQLQDDAIREPLFLGAYTILSTQIDFVQSGGGIPDLDVRSWAAYDNSAAVLLMPVPDRPAFAVKGLKFLHAIGVSEPWTAGRGMPFNRYLAAIMDVWKSLKACQKAVVVNLYSVHDGVFLYPVLLATRQFGSGEYAEAVLVHRRVAGTAGGTGASSSYAEFDDDASACLHYLEYWP